MNTMQWTRAIVLVIVAASFPVAGFLAFNLGFNRELVADWLSVTYGVGIVAALSLPLWPSFRSTRCWSFDDRIESLVMTFLPFSYFTHLSWELGWVLLREKIAAARHEQWAYAWWAYIDGGDLRYADMANVELLAMEVLSVLNGLVGMYFWLTYILTGIRKRGKRNLVCILVMGASAVVHLYSALLYFMGELLAGLPNVKRTFVGTFIKFFLANSPWIWAPWFVFYWVATKMHSQHRAKLE